MTLGTCVPKLRFQKLPHRLSVRDRASELQLEGSTLAGFITAHDRDDLVRPGYGAHGAEEPEGVTGLEHADGHNFDALHLLRPSLLPQPDQGLLENAFRGERLSRRFGWFASARL